MEKLRNMRKEEMVNTCIENCRKIYNDIKLSESDIQSCKTLTYEILDKLIVQTETRFGDLNHIEFIELLNEKNLGANNLKFPVKNVKIPCIYLLFFQPRLRNELKNIYRQRKIFTPKSSSRIYCQ